MAIASRQRNQAASQFRIEATGSSYDPRTRIVKHGDTFAVLSAFGDMVGGTGCPDGLYHQDTRFLSQLELALNGEYMDVRSGDQEPPNIVGVVGQEEVAVGAVTLDRNYPQACWIWAVSDNLRLIASNSMAVARQLL